MVGIARIGILALLVWATVAMFTWNTYTPPQPGKVVGAARNSGEPDFAPPPDLKLDLGALVKADIWGMRATAAGQPGSAGPAKVPAEVWSRVAIVKEAAGAFVLLSSPSGEIKPFKTGDTLPDGSKLLKITTSEIVVKPASGSNQAVHLLN